MAQVVFVVHGVGNDAGTAQKPAVADWTAEIKSTLLAAAAHYPGIDTTPLIFEPILYDDVFQRFARNWEELSKSLHGTPLARETDFMKDAAEGGFLWGSIGDVVQYRALELVRENVKTVVAAKIADAVKRHGINHSYSVLAHSLGTAVAHDAIGALATRSVEGITAAYPSNLRFDNFFALANVSRLVWATTDDFYATTRVRPRESGLPDDACAVDYYLDVRHVADPIASIVRFAPRNWSTGLVQETVRHMNDLNVHAFVHYLQSPLVSDLILSRLFPAEVTPDLFKKRTAPPPDDGDATAKEKARLVASVEKLLDALSGQANGRFDLKMLASALLKSRRILSGEPS